jgi:chemotaxis signal transduction protein
MLPHEAFDKQKELSEHANSEDGIAEKNQDYLISFKIGDGFFAMDFDKIHEVVDFYPYIHYPEESNNHKGVINLRGNIIPIIDPFNSKNQVLAKEKRYKYIILHSEELGSVGIIAETVKKIAVESEILQTCEESIILTLEIGPVRYIKESYIFSKFRSDS